jgi:Tfp pilus assembly protein PilO
MIMQKALKRWPLKSLTGMIMLLRLYHMENNFKLILVILLLVILVLGLTYVFYFLEFKEKIEVYEKYKER